MCTDTLDRVEAILLELRFTRAQIKTIQEDGGLKDLSFSVKQPFGCALAIWS